ncbi:MAG: hypothetical protein LQ350_008122 [Teloschistes chrysophthalmus]|nr:MAG: hypothetical protein LQ350_008122 [Niorma chrysophthalma]
MDVLTNLFIEYGADPNGLGPSGFGGYYGTPLNAAIRRGNMEIFNMLLEKGADPNISGSKKNWTALEMACVYKQQEAFNTLLERNLNLYAIGRCGTLLQAAAFAGSKPMAKELVHRGLDVNANGHGPYGNSLQSAAIRGQEDVVRFLIRRGADVKAKGGQFGSVLQAASIRGSKTLIDFLIHKGARVDEQGGRYRTALQAACASGNKEVVLTLLEQKANVNITGGRYGSALQAACKGGRLEIVRMLVEHGADIEAQAGYHGTAIDAAARHSRKNVLRYLIKDAGATQTTVNRQRNHMNNTWLEWADKNISTALKEPEPKADAANESYEIPFSAPNDDDDDGVNGINQEPLMNIESIPQYDPTTASLPEDTAPSTSPSPEPSANADADGSNSEGESSETTAPPPSESAPKGKKYWRRLARKESNKTAVKEEEVGGDGEDEGVKAEDMSALSWLQVQCGYGGDLNGPGR